MASCCIPRLDLACTAVRAAARPPFFFACPLTAAIVSAPAAHALCDTVYTGYIVWCRWKCIMRLDCLLPLQMLPLQMLPLIPRSLPRRLPTTLPASNLMYQEALVNHSSCACGCSGPPAHVGVAAHPAGTASLAYSLAPTETPCSHQIQNLTYESCMAKPLNAASVGLMQWTSCPRRCRSTSCGRCPASCRPRCWCAP
jgi:hypothetical protein